MHTSDIQKLLHSLNMLVEAGHTVLVIEHHLDVIKTADWVIDLDADGGKAGSRIVAQVAESYTGQFLWPVLEGKS